MQRTEKRSSIINKEVKITDEVWCISTVSGKDAASLYIEGMDDNGKYVLIEANLKRNFSNKIEIEYCKATENSKELLSIVNNFDKYISKSAQVSTWKINRFQVDDIVELIKKDMQSAKNGTLNYGNVKKTTSNNTVSLPAYTIEDLEVEEQKSFNTNELEWPMQKIQQINLILNKPVNHLKHTIDLNQTNKIINQCTLAMTESGEFNFLNILQSIKNMCAAYRSDYKVFSNTHDNVAAKFTSVINDLENDCRKHLESPKYYYETTQCLIIALQEILTKKKSDKFQNHLNILYKQYPGLKNNASLLDTKFRNEINGIKEHITSGKSSTSYEVHGLEPFKKKHQEIYEIKENDMQQDLSKFYSKKK